MKRSRLLTGSALAAICLSLGSGAVVAPSASSSPSTESWNCRKVIARDVRFFATATSDALTPPYELVRNDLFKSFGVSNGRYSAQARKHGTFWAGWVTGDSSYVTRVPDSTCNW